MIVTATKATLTAHHIEKLKQIVGEKYLLADEESMLNYAHDETEDLHFLPEVVVKPRNAEEISAILKICNRDKIPVTPSWCRHRLKRRSPGAPWRSFIVYRTIEFNH